LATIKILRAFFCLAFLAALASRLPGQTAAIRPEASDPGVTQINSETLEMDQARLISVFTGNVVVTGNNFNLTCDDMTIFFTSASKVDTIVAHGHVIINQPGLVAHCGRAQYFHAEDKFVLTVQPDVVKNNTEVTAPTITVWRATQMMKTDGPSTTKFIGLRP
jgi:lipopolysaccharide transport protein LptA